MAGSMQQQQQFGGPVPPISRYHLTFKADSGLVDCDIEAHNFVAQGPMIVFIRMISENVAISYAAYNQSAVNSVVLVSPDTVH
jgi:hypothetical protein